jgi:hypothetical protein
MDVIHPNPVIDGVRVASASGVRSPALSAFFDGVEISEDGVREAVFAQRLPQVLGRVQPRSRAISAAELPGVARISTHWMRGYSAWLPACFRRSASLATVGLSPTIRRFIHGSLKSVEAHDISSIERKLV